jgi:MFS family permease
VTVGGVLNDTFDLYQRFFWRFVAIAAVVYVVLDFLSALLSTVDTDNWLVVVFWALVSVALGIIGFFWLAGALVEAVQDVRDGRIDNTIGELFERVRPQLPALIVAGVLAGLGILGGLILFIIPGLFLLTRWALIAPVIVLEKRRAGEAFSRSWDLVKGHSWSVFAVIIITGIGSSIVSGIIQGVLRAILPDFLGDWLGALAAHVVTAPFVAIAWTVMYFKLAQPAVAEPAPATETPSTFEQP